MIRELTVQDTGTYHCGVDTDLGMHNYTQVKLKVKEDPSYEKSISETVHVGRDLNISCKYPESLRSNPKFLCKSLQSAICSRKASGTHADIMKFILYDDREGQTLNLTLKNLTERDSGEYWCGAEADWESDDGYKVYFTQINLAVTAISSPPGTVVSSPSSPSSSSSPPSSSPPSPESTPTFSPSLYAVSIALTVLVNIVIGLLIGSGCLFVILRIKHKIEARTAAHDRRSAADTGNGPEDFKDTRRLVASEVGTTVSSTVQLPTIPSDPPQTVYPNTVLPASRCDSASRVSTLSDSSTNSVEKSAEGPTYATVRFHSDGSSSNDAALKIRFKNEAESCEYATVSHGHS
ncbi:uncharacterized protein Hap1MRO34_007524 [Clarias gariepinus]